MQTSRRKAGFLRADVVKMRRKDCRNASCHHGRALRKPGVERSINRRSRRNRYLFFMLAIGEKIRPRFCPGRM
jgi:hypothetical protein